jgi:glycosyltransferase involved in cell wall biosynthesis
MLDQTYRDFWLIIVDNGSIDDTREVLEQCTGQVVCEMHPNIGETRIVNKG